MCGLCVSGCLLDSERRAGVKDEVKEVRQAGLRAVECDTSSDILELLAHLGKSHGVSEWSGSKSIAFKCSTHLLLAGVGGGADDDDLIKERYRDVHSAPSRGRNPLITRESIMKLRSTISYIVRKLV